MRQMVFFWRIFFVVAGEWGWYNYRVFYLGNAFAPSGKGMEG